MMDREVEFWGGPLDGKRLPVMADATFVELEHRKPEVTPVKALYRRDPIDPCRFVWQESLA